MAIYDNSSLQAFKDCPERYRLHYIEGLIKRKEGEESHDKNFGKAIHSALEVHYAKRKANEVSPLEAVLSAFEKEYPTQLNEEDKAKTLENGKALLQSYINFYKEQDTQWEILEVEVADTLKLCDEIEFSVKIDLVVKQQGCIYFVDHKTTGKPFNWMYWSRFEPNPQITAYTAYCLAKYGECSGGIVNGIRLGHRERMYKGQPAGFYAEFQRQIFNRNQNQVAAWKWDTMEWLAKIEQTKKDYSIASCSVWPKNEGQCGYCEYKEVCISCNDDQIKEQLYEKVDPFRYLKGEVQSGADN